MSFVKRVTVSLCALALCVTQPLITGAATTWDVVVNGLDNPRGVAFGPEGALYIAQAGSGGDGPCGPGPEGTRCYGETGAISRYDPATGAFEDVVTGLPSLATEDGHMFAIGRTICRCMAAVTFSSPSASVAIRRHGRRCSGLTAQSWPVSDVRRRMANGACWPISAVSRLRATRTGDEVDSRIRTGSSPWQASRW